MFWQNFNDFFIVNLIIYVYYNCLFENMLFSVFLFFRFGLYLPLFVSFIHIHVRVYICIKNNAENQAKNRKQNPQI